MGEKNNQETRLSVDGKTVAYGKVESGFSTQANGGEQTFRNMIEKQCHTMAFDMTCDEEATDFFRRMEKDIKEKEDAFKERIESLFNEYCEITSKHDKEVYNQLLTLFSIGYRLGWNDYYQLNKEEIK